MAYIEISNLPETLNLDDNSIFPVVFQGKTKKVAFDTIKAILNYFVSVSYNKTTGVFTYTRVDGTIATLSTDLQEGIKTITLSDGVLTFTKNDNSTFNLTISVPDEAITKAKLVQELQNKIDAIDNKYEKPDTGIPSTDLASAVQTSLGKADTALQSTDIVSSVDSSSTNSKAVGAKLFYDTIGNLEDILEELDIGGGV